VGKIAKKLKKHPLLLNKFFSTHKAKLFIPHHSCNRNIAQKPLVDNAFERKNEPSNQQHFRLNKIQRILIFGRTSIETIYLRKGNDFYCFLDLPTLVAKF